MTITTDNSKVEKLFDEDLDLVQGGSFTVAAACGAIAAGLVANVIYDVGKAAGSAIIKKISKKNKKNADLQIQTYDAGVACAL